MFSMFRIFCLIFLLVMTSTAFSGNKNPASDVRFATVKITTTSVRPNYCIPWKMKTHNSMVGSGVIIFKNLILTNAHVVSDATFIEVQKERDPKRYEARVLHIGHECDLALLGVRDSSFFEGTANLEFGGIPDLKSVVATYGYPAGGSRISITEGIVSRIEIGTYVHSSRVQLLRIQTDAAINRGNSGGPVIQNGKIVGIAFQAILNSNNIGYMIPVPIISHFLKDIADGQYHGFPDLGIFHERLINDSYREYLNMGKYQSGIIVKNIIKGASAEKHLKTGDIIMKVEGIPIANDGSIAFGNGRILYGVVIDQKQIGEPVSLEILRGRRIMSLSIPLRRTRGRIPWYNEFETLPRYFIFGGIVFQPLNREYLKCWNKWWLNADRRMLYYFTYSEQDLLSLRRKEFVVLNHVLPDTVNTYVSDLTDKIIQTINKRPINSLADVVDAVKKPLGKYHVIMVEGVEKPIILNVMLVQKANKRILEKYRIPSDRRL